MSKPPIDSIGPARAATIVGTGSDTIEFDTATRGILVGVSGDVQVDMMDTEGVIVLPALAAGVIHPISCTRIYASNTTATGIVALF